jgi:hypothetical protein
MFMICSVWKKQRIKVLKRVFRLLKVVAVFAAAATGTVAINHQ